MESLEEIDIAIVGGGIVGCILACKLAEKGHEPIVFEKSAVLADAQSAHNSGVIHSGVYYTPGSHKADLCVRGNEIMYSRCKTEDIATQRVKKLIVATTPDEEKILELLLKRGIANGVEGLEIISGKEARRHEPNVHARAALFVPSTGIVDGAKYVRRWSERAKSQAYVMPEAEITSIEPFTDSFIVGVTYKNRSRYDGEEGMRFRTRVVVNTAGLGAGKIAHMINPDFDFFVKGRLGDYCQFNSDARTELHTNGMCIYPTPVIEGDNVVATLGVHTTSEFGVRPPELSKTVSLGPTSRPFILLQEGAITEIKETYIGDPSIMENLLLLGQTGEEIKIKEVSDFDKYQHEQVYCAERVSKREFVEAVQPWYPSIAESDVVAGQYGIQVRIETRTGDVHCDFIFGPDKRYGNGFHAIMPSPGFTSAEPAADDLAEMIDQVLR